MCNLGGATAGIALAMFVFGGGPLSAAVVDLRNAMRAETGLIHHYTFEGPQTDSANLRLLDLAGTDDLKVWRNGLLTNVVYGTGFDELSVGGMPAYVSTNFGTGAGWTSTSSIALPPTLTVECLFSPHQVPADSGCVLGSRQSDATRGYYVWLTNNTNVTTRVGAANARTIINQYVMGHWYYVVSTYSLAGAKTTINSFYADLTAGGVLLQMITNAVDSGSYGTNAVLGVGCLPNLSSVQYPAPCQIDEAALYDSVLDVGTISNHLAELRRELPPVEYREIFPNDGSTAARSFPREGWKAHCGTNALSTAIPVVEEFNTAFDVDLAAVASSPQDAGATQGYLNNHVSPTGSNYLYWTEELTNRLDVGWLKLISLDARCGSNRTVRVALRVDTNATPQEVADDAWFCGADFDHADGTSALELPWSESAWHRHWFDVSGGEWAALRFVPAAQLVRDESEVPLPTNGLVTAFGLLQDWHEYQKNARLDNFTIYARRVNPPPPERGTLIRIH